MNAIHRFVLPEIIGRAILSQEEAGFLGGPPMSLPITCIEPSQSPFSFTNAAI
jgi:hypothetical protein